MELRRREDALIVTEARPLVAYLLSGSRVRRRLGALPPSDAARRVATVTGTLERRMVDGGAIRIAKDSGLFVARGLIGR